MKLRLHNLIVAFLLILSIGGHWVILQSGAWIGMFISFSRTDSVAVAVLKTFDGNHPCTLCKLVTEAKKAEKGDDRQLTKLKIDLFLVRNEALFLNSPPQQFDFQPPVFVGSLLAAPPTPPPRHAPSNSPIGSAISAQV